VSINPTKKHVDAMIDQLSVTEVDGETITVEQMARAVLKLAWSQYEERAKFSLVCQNLDDKKDRLLLGCYATEKQAIASASSMAYLTSSGEHYKCWVLRSRFTTPHEVGKERKAEAQVRDGHDPDAKARRAAAGSTPDKDHHPHCQELYTDHYGLLKECLRPAGHDGDHSSPTTPADIEYYKTHYGEPDD